MPPIARITEPGSDTTVFRVTGEVDADQIAREIIEFLTTAATPLVVWDYTMGSLHTIPTPELRSIVDRAGPYTGARAGGRTAIVCSTDVDFGLSRMFEAFAESGRIPFEIRVFRDMGTARAWLHESNQNHPLG